MDPITQTALAQGAFNLLGAGVSGKLNHEEALLARQWQEKMWNLQNEYNLPVNQVQRLKDAGINPNLAFGSAASTMSANVPSSPARGNWNIDVGNVAQDYFRNKYERESVLSQIRERNAATHKVELENKAMETILDDYISAKLWGYRAEAVKGRFMTDRGQEWFGTELLGKQFKNDLIKAEISLAEAKRSLTNANVRRAVQDYNHLVHKYSFEDNYYRNNLNPYETSTIAGLARSINGIAATVASNPTQVLKQIDKGLMFISPAAFVLKNTVGPSYRFYRRESDLLGKWIYNKTSKNKHYKW